MLISTFSALKESKTKNKLTYPLKKIRMNQFFRGELGIDCKLGKKPVPHFKLAKLGMNTLRIYFA